jgi:hypothetical protein
MGRRRALLVRWLHAGRLHKERAMIGQLPIDSFFTRYFYIRPNAPIGHALASGKIDSMERWHIYVAVCGEIMSRVMYFWTGFIWSW